MPSGFKIMYYKNQIFLAVVAAIFFAFSFFFYIQNNVMSEELKEETHIIIDKKCSNAPRMSSSINISHKDKIYVVSLPGSDCFESEIGQKVKLLYNKNFDYYILPGHNKVYTIRLIATSIGLLLSIIPWKLLRSKLGLQ